MVDLLSLLASNELTAFHLSEIKLAGIGRQRRSHHGGDQKETKRLHGDFLS